MASPTLTTTFTEQLDRFESSLPTIPARIVRLQRTLAGAAYDQYANMFQAWTDSTKAFLGTARVSGKSTDVPGRHALPLTVTSAGSYSAVAPDGSKGSAPTISGAEPADNACVAAPASSKLRRTPRVSTL